jgi:serine/threonine-protein kinase
MTAVPAPPLPGTIGGKYRVLAQIGKGGMATVYSAVHVGTDRRVAIKVMSAEGEGKIDCDADSTSDRSQSLTRFEREARIAGNLDTQHVTRVFDTGFDPVHGPYIVMELLSGDDLKDLILRLGPLRPELSLRIVAQACIGIARAHALGVVHRDVKASNIFLAGDEFGARVVKVLDFGIAKGRRGDVVDAADPKTLTKTGAMLGSPHYMSPEQVLGTKALDHRADIWSLGVLLYKCLSARTPFDDRDTVGQIIVAIVQGAPPPVQNYAPWVAPEIASVIARALKTRPEDRFQDAHQMYEAIRALVPGGDLSISPAMLTPMTDEERRDAKPRLSARVTLPDGTLAERRLADAAKIAVAAVSGPEVDSTIDGSASSARWPQVQSRFPRSTRSKLGVVLLALGVSVAAVWGMTRREHGGSSQAVAASAPVTPTEPTGARPPASATAIVRHVPLQVQPPADSIEVDGVTATLDHGSVDVSGELGSVHKVSLRGSGREMTVEVIITDDGARPRAVGLPVSASPAATAPARRSVPSQAPRAPQPAKSTNRFDTQFE